MGSGSSGAPWVKSSPGRIFTGELTALVVTCQCVVDVGDGRKVGAFPRRCNCKFVEEQRPHCNLDFDYSCELPRLVVAEGGRLLKLHFARSPAAEWNDELFYKRGGVRGVCKGFSFGSRRRMLDRLNSVSVGASLPQFVTMTLPDESFCDDIGEFAKRAKHWLDTWLKRLARVAPGACGFWRIEWKWRQSGLHEGQLFPHFHLLVWGLAERQLREEYPEQLDYGEWVLRPAVFEAYVSLRDCQLSLELLDLWSAASRNKPMDQCRVRVEYSDGRVFAGSGRFVGRAQTLQDRCSMMELEGLSEGQRQVAEWARNMSFQDWASLAWYHVVDSHNLDHAQAGVRVERVRTWGGVLSYCAKYMAKADCQFMAEISWGRSWGIFNRARVPWAKIIELPLDNETGVRLRRVARHLLERRLKRRVRAPYGVTLYCDTERFRRLWEHPPPDPF